MAESPPLKTRLLIFIISSLVTAVLAEGMIRLADGNALPMIRLFHTDQQGHITLQPNGVARVSSPRGEPWEITTDPLGRRIPPQPLSEKAWIVVGDSQVMGNGVANDEAFPSRLELHGEAAHNLGVPGYGVGDALWSATKHLDQFPDAGGVIVIVNQMNDWEETDSPVGVRYQERGGWLIDAKDADGSRGQFLASPLARSHLGFLLGHLILRDWGAPDEPVPEWMLDPASQREKTLIIANAIGSFVASHPETKVVPVYLPADVYASEGRKELSPLTKHITKGESQPWKDVRLRNQILTALAALEPIDLTPVLREKSAFLEMDYHLSAVGHQAVADLIMQQIAENDSPVEASTKTPEIPRQ